MASWRRFALCERFLVYIVAVLTAVTVTVMCSVTLHPTSGVPNRGLGGGLEPLPLANDLRNKRVRKRQNMIFSTKIRNIFWAVSTAPSPDPSPVGGLYMEGDTPSPLLTPRRLRHLNPSRSKILGTPLHPPRDISCRPCLIHRQRT